MAEDDVAAAAGQADQGGVVAFAFGAFAVVEGLGRGVAQAGEGGQEHGVFEPVVAAAAAGLAGEAGAGLRRVTRARAGVGGEFAAVGEGGAVANFGEDAGAGPWPDPWHGRQQLTERVREERLLDLSGQGVAARAGPVEVSAASSAMTRPVAASAGTVTSWAASAAATVALTLAAIRGERALTVRSMRDWLAARSAVSVAGTLPADPGLRPGAAGPQRPVPGLGRCW